MKAWLALLACSLVNATARAQDLTAELACVPAEGVVGEPVEWILEVRHASGTRVAPVEEDPLQALPEIERLSWALLSGPRVETERASDGTARTRFLWRMISLESGERALPDLSVRAEDGTTATATGAKLEIWSDLAEGEDLPRPIAGLHDVETSGAFVGPFQIVLGLAALALALAALWWWRARRAGPRAHAAPGPRERLAALRGALPSTPAGSQEFAFELSHLLRAAVEERIEGDLAGPADTETGFAGLTDEEWFARTRAAPGISARVLDELAALLADLARIKYAGETPTRFRVEELLGASEALLARIAEPAPAGAGAATDREVAA